jgi:hypothetical protein
LYHCLFPFLSSSFGERNCFATFETSLDVASSTSLFLSRSYALPPPACHLPPLLSPVALARPRSSHWDGSQARAGHLEVAQVFPLFFLDRAGHSRPFPFPLFTGPPWSSTIKFAITTPSSPNSSHPRVGYPIVHQFHPPAPLHTARAVPVATIFFYNSNRATVTPSMWPDHLGAPLLHLFHVLGSRHCLDAHRPSNFRNALIDALERVRGACSTRRSRHHRC